MSDDLKGAIITAIVTSIISIIGFIITNASMKKSFRNELIIQRDSVALEKMSTIPYEFLKLMDDMMNTSKKKTKPDLDVFNKLLNEIYSYGSEKAIALVAAMQTELYAADGDKNKMNQYRTMSYYVLLATQIKYDVTGVYVNPELWFKMRIKDFQKSKNEIIEANNTLVKELGLDDKLKMKKS